MGCWTRAEARSLPVFFFRGEQVAAERLSAGSTTHRVKRPARGYLVRIRLCPGGTISPLRLFSTPLARSLWELGGVPLSHWKVGSVLLRGIFIVGAFLPFFPSL